MFERAAKRHFYWNTLVGGSNGNDEYFQYGMGCVLDKSHVLTARHCLDAVAENKLNHLVFRLDGIFDCEVVFESAPHDIAVLKATRKRPDKADTREYGKYPTLASEPFFLGKSVGFISTLRLFNNETRLTHFSQASVSAFMEDETDKFSRVLLSSTVVQTGFSGSAVFDSAGTILGIIVERLRFRAESEDKTSHIYVLPKMSSILPVRKQISDLLTPLETN